MMRLLSVRHGLLLLAATALFACGEQAGPLAPATDEPAPSFAHVPQRALDVVVRPQSDRQFVSASVWVTPREGGKVSAGGVTLTIPAGAVDRPARVGMTVTAGGPLAVEFAPHGLHFARPATLSVDLTATAVVRDAAARGSLIGVYFVNAIRSGRVVPLETYPVRIDASGSVASFSIEHFSGYTLAEG